MKLTIIKPDTLGALASSFCLVHCILTPVLLLSQFSALWWGNLDYVFLGLSLFAVTKSAKQSAKQVMKPALWLVWLTLAFLLVNEKFHGIELPEILTYISAVSLAALHVYNLKYCQCETEDCCVNEN